MTSSCKRVIHNAETRPIPKILVIRSNIGQVAPGLKLEIIRSFESLPDAWYCRHYGSGGGTTSWFTGDTVMISNFDAPITISLRLERETYCPYVLHGVFLLIVQAPQIKPHDLAFIWALKDTPNVKWDVIPSKLKVDLLRDSSYYTFPNEDRILYHYSIPTDGRETLAVEIETNSLNQNKE
jgi:hypothetical protein